MREFLFIITSNSGILIVIQDNMTRITIRFAFEGENVRGAFWDPPPGNFL